MIDVLWVCVLFAGSLVFCDFRFVLYGFVGYLIVVGLDWLVNSVDLFISFKLK